VLKEQLAGELVVFLVEGAAGDEDSDGVGCHAVEGRQAEYNAALGGRRQDEAVVFNAEARSFGGNAEFWSFWRL
jgi:hypothetical protein